MLTTTVMQHEGGAVGQFSTGPAEAKDLLSRLRHLHHTLQECHWRVQVVDHALCAQGDKGHCGLQNQTGKEHTLIVQDKKDCSLQNQVKEIYCLQHEIGKGCNTQNKTGKDQDPEDEIICTREQLEVDRLQNKLREDEHCQNEVGETSGVQLCEDSNHQKPNKEEHSSLNTSTEDEEHSQQAEGDNSDHKENPDYTSDDSSLSEMGKNDLIVHNHAKKDDYIPKETKEQSDIQNSIKIPCGVDVSSTPEKRNKYLMRQKNVDIDDDDPLLTNFLNADSPDPDVDNISPVSGTITDIKEQNLQLSYQTAKFSEIILKQEKSQEKHHGRKVRHRPGNTLQLDQKSCYEELTELYKKQRKDTISQDQQQKIDEIECVKLVDKLSPVDPSPEVVQRMDVIWEALENLRSHFIALHSSLVDSSNLFCSQEFSKSSDNYFTAIRENDSISKCGKLNTPHEELPGETTHLQETPYEQSLPRKLPVENYPHCVCQSLPEHQTSSHTHQYTTTNSQALSDTPLQRRVHWQSWRDNCFCVMMTVLLLLLALFFASCLLLVLPVVSVSVRTAGGLPAF